MRNLVSALCAALLATAAVQAAPDDERWIAEARKMLADTVAMRTAVGHGKVPGMARYLAARLVSAGFPPADVEIELMGETATLVVRYRSKDPLAPPPILILAHMDVVDADPADWELDPFELTERDGYLFGRGAQDNKLGIVLTVTTFARLREAGFTPSRDLYLVFTGDEESTQETTAVLAAREELRAAAFALNTDVGGGYLSTDGTPVAYFMQAAEKTYASFRITMRNAGGHSSLPRDDNAIYDLARALGRIEAYRFPVRTNEITEGFLTAMGRLTNGPVGDAMLRLAENPQDAEAAEVLRRRPDIVGTTRTTCVATMLDAGHAENALPQRASATVNCRIFPDVDPEQVRTALKEMAGESAEVTLINKAFYASSSPLDETVSAAVTTAVQARVPGLPVVPSMSSGYTDASFFRAAGVPTYGVAAPFMRAEDSFAHGLNERIPVSSLPEGLAHWDSLIHSLAGH